MATSSDYTSCAVIHPSGWVQKGNVRCVNLDRPESAVEKLSAGKVAWVREGDAETVLAAWRGADDR